jgi:hypothetical protein
MMQEGQTLIRVNGREIVYPPADLTMGEMCDAENYFGVDFSDPERSGMRLAAALLYSAIKRVDRTVTVQDIRDLDPEILGQLAEGDASPPAPAAGGSNGRSSPSSPAPGDAPPEPTPASTGSPGSATGSPVSPL